MGNPTSKMKPAKEAGNPFERQRNEQGGTSKPTKSKKKKNKKKSRFPKKVKPNPHVESPGVRVPVDNRPPMISYDDEVMKIMRVQIKNDPNAFLLNNIMLATQFFDNYERVIYDLKNNSISQSDVTLNENMADHQKHVFLPDKLLEHVNEHVQFIRKYDESDFEQSRENAPRKAIMLGKSKSKIPEPLQAQRMFVIHDNIEVDEPGKISDYSTVTGAPFYKMLIERSDEPGYVKLRQHEAIQGGLRMDKKESLTDVDKSDATSESERDSITSTSSRESEKSTAGKKFMNELGVKIQQTTINSPIKVPEMLQRNPLNTATAEPRPSGISKQKTPAIIKGELIHHDVKPKSKTKEKKNSVTSDSSGYGTTYSNKAESISTESSYGYATITAETTPRRLEISQSAKHSDSTSVIPIRCISTVEVKRIHGSSDEDEIEDAYALRNGNYERDLYKKLYYLNSNMFMIHFSDLFLLKLSHSLGFDTESLSQAMTQGATIYCNTYANSANKSYEVLPAVNSNWPNDAMEWSLRPRMIITNPRTNFKYQWPTQHMLSKSRGLGCLIIPLGFRPTRGNNPQKGLQWRLAFPAVERYLETCMAHSQVRCFIFSLTLFRTFMEIQTSHIGIETWHIKNHLYSKLEENFARWPEDRLGEALMIFLKSFYDRLKKDNLPDFFIPQCNLLKGIPKSVLLRQQRRLADIIESPVMHLLAAMKNLKYVKKDYYPVLDVKKLYNILTTTDILKLANPGLMFANAVVEENENDKFKDTKLWDKLREDDSIAHVNPEYNWRRQLLLQKEAKKAALISSRTVTKSHIDRKKKIVDFDMNRRRMVLQLFIPHFISMSDWSVQFESYKQAMIYLEHCKRLITLLKEEPGGEIDADRYRNQIEAKIQIVRNNIGKPGAPQVPKRNESFSNFASTSRPRNNSEQYLSIINANNENEHKHQPDSPTIKINGPISVEVHSETERRKSQRVVSFLRVDEEEEVEDESNDYEESRL